jgi:hypothetical protein
MEIKSLTKEQAQIIEGDSYNEDTLYYLFYKINNDELTYVGMGRTTERTVSQDGKSGKNYIKVDYTERDINVKELLNK